MAEHIARYWVDWLMGLFAIALGCLWKWARGKFRTLEAMKAADLALLHDRIYQACKYHISVGYIDVESLKNIECLYKAYHNLGGNGTGTQLYDRVMALPLEERED